MAKKDKDAAFNEFLADLKATVGESSWAAIEDSLIKNEAANTKLRSGVLARADYSAKMDQLTEQQATFAQEVAEARQKIDGWKNWYGTATTQFASLQNKVKAYEDSYGPLEDGDPAKIARRTGLTREEVDTLLAQREQQRDVANLKFADDLTDIKIDFRDRFKDKLDTEAVYKIAGERGVDLKTAYNYHIAARVEEQREKDVEARIAKAKEDAVAEFASKHNFPAIDTRSDITPHVLDAKNIPNSQHDRVQAALAAFTTARK